MSHMTIMYGGPPNPGTGGRPPAVPDPVIPNTGDLGELTKRARLLAPEARHRLRVSVMVEADGTVRLKVLDGDRLVCETTGRGTITIETEI